MPVFGVDVVQREIDKSLFVPAIGLTAFGVVGGAHKGEKDKVIDIASQAEYIRKLGNPTTHMGRVAFQYLRSGRQLKVCRVARNDVVATVAVNDSTPAMTLTVNARSSGEGFNGLKIFILASAVGGASKFKLVVEEAGVPVETWENLDKTTIEGIINATNGTGSEFISVVNNIGNANPPALNQTYTLAGGNSGITGLLDSDFIGTITGTTKTGMQVFSNPEEVEIDLFAVPGISSSAVVVAGFALMDTRKDCYYLVDPPFGLNVDQVIDFHNGTGAYTTHPIFNTSRASVDWPWHKLYDPYTAKEEWVPPSGITAGVIAGSDAVSDPWISSAGLSRGFVGNSLGIEYSPSKEERLKLNSFNRINPYVNFKSDGIVRWGNETLQRATTALQSEHIRRMLFYCEKAFQGVARRVNFEPHDKKTWKQLENLANSVLDPVKSRRGLTDYRIIIDETLNTPDVIDQEQLFAKMLLKPTRKVKTIIVDWTLLRTGALFEEFV